MASLRQMTSKKNVKLGTFVIEFDSPGIGQILRAAGCEFVIVDMEHSGFTYYQVKRMLHYFQSAGLPVIVGTAVHNYETIARVCDLGANGVQPAKISTADEAREALAHMRYPPEGHRGVALGIAHDKYESGPVKNKLHQANKETIFFPKIETPEGIRNIDSIAAIDGVAGIWIGHFDLSVGMGIPGQFDHPDFSAAIKAVATACRTHNISLGRIAEAVKDGSALLQQGFDFLCYSGDSWILRDALRAGISGIRSASEDR